MPEGSLGYLRNSHPTQKKHSLILFSPQKHFDSPDQHFHAKELVAVRNFEGIILEKNEERRKIENEKIKSRNQVNVSNTHISPISLFKNLLILDNLIVEF